MGWRENGFDRSQDLPESPVGMSFARPARQRGDSSLWRIGALSMRRGRVGLSVNGSPSPREWTCTLRCTGAIVHNTKKGKAAVMRYGCEQGNSSRAKKERKQEEE